MHCHADFVRFLSFFGYGCLCLIASCMGLYGFMTQNAYHSVDVVQASEVRDDSSLRLASQFKGIQSLNDKRDFQPLGLGSIADQNL